MDGERVAPGTLSTPPVRRPDRASCPLMSGEAPAGRRLGGVCEAAAAPQRTRLLVYGLGSFGDALQLTPAAALPTQAFSRRPS